MYFDLQNYPKAREMLTTVVSTSPKSIEAMYQLAKVMVKMRDNQSATALLKKVLKLKPTYMEARKLLDSINS